MADKGLSTKISSSLDKAASTVIVSKRGALNLKDTFIPSVATALGRLDPKYDSVSERILKNFSSLDPSRTIKDISDRFGLLDRHTNHIYKRVFLRMVDKAIPLAKGKSRTEKESAESSVRALAAFRAIFNSIEEQLKTLSSLYLSGSSPRTADSADEDDDDAYDESLDKDVHKLEKDVGIRGKKKKKKKKKKKNRFTVSYTPEEYSSYAKEHGKDVDLLKSVLSGVRSELIDYLKYSSPVAFGLIKKSASAAFSAVTHLEELAQVAEKERQPAVLIACLAVSKEIQEVASILRESVPITKKNRKEMNSKLQELKRLMEVSRRV